MTEPDASTSRSVSRRTVLRTLAAGATAGTLGSVAGAAEDYWTVVALPDTQYSARDERYVRAQAQWVVDNLRAEHVAFLSHVGDVVQNPDRPVEWEYVDGAMSLLDGEVPYATIPGDHDYLSRDDGSPSIQQYREYFGPDRFRGREWYAGSGPENGGQNRANLSSYQLFSAGGYEFLHLALQWEAPGTVTDPSTPLGWAQAVLDRYPDRPTILTTHSYLSAREEARTTSAETTDGNSGERVWQSLVSPNAQIFMVLCGHSWRRDGEHHQVSQNEACGSVYELLANYQGQDERGEGYFRRIEFRPGEGEAAPDRIQVRTYSPVLDEYMTDDSSEFAFDVDFATRFGASAFATDCSGDADGDGDIDARDSDLVQRRLADGDADFDAEAADMDGDGDVDIGDAVRIRKKGRGY